MYEKLSALADRLDTVREQVLTEEAAKTALVLPFIKELGYDIFNPAEVIPEFIADVGIKKGEKVDYAICINGSPSILIECKGVGAKLDSYSSQLFRYFSTTRARIAILTDGVEYRFFSDLAEPNKLDVSPFFVFSLDRLKKDDSNRVKQFSKNSFDIEKVLANAESLQIKTAIRAHFAEELKNPSERFIKYFASPIHNGSVVQGVIDRYRPLLIAALDEHIGNAVNDRLQSALQSNAPAVENTESKAVETEEDHQEPQEIVTTVEELNGFYIVKAILRNQVAPERIVSRDVQSYFGVLLDDNNRKPICRLLFNRSQKYLVVFDAKKKPIKIPITGVDDLFNHADAIRESLGHVIND